MAETPDKNKTSADAENSVMDAGSNDSEPSNNGPHVFDFTLRTPRVLKHAVEALCDPDFNPTEQGVVQVGDFGFEITVLVIDSDTKKEIFGYLRLLKADLEEFQCSKPLEKMISLRSLYLILKDAVGYSDEDHPLAFFAEDGSNKLTFQWGKKAQVSIDLDDVTPEYRKFPTVTYGFEAVISRNILKNTLTEVLQMRPTNRPTDGQATFKASTVHIQLTDEVVLSTENQVEQHEVWVNWHYWDTLEKASNLADNCSMYLVTDPPHNVMLRFSLEELGDLVYLIQANFLSANTVTELPSLGLFRPLKTRRFFTKK